MLSALQQPGPNGHRRIIDVVDISRTRDPFWSFLGRCCRSIDSVWRVTDRGMKPDRWWSRWELPIWIVCVIFWKQVFVVWWSVSVWMENEKNWLKKCLVWIYFWSKRLLSKIPLRNNFVGSRTSNTAENDNVLRHFTPAKQVSCLIYEAPMYRFWGIHWLRATKRRETKFVKYHQVIPVYFRLLFRNNLS